MNRVILSVAGLAALLTAATLAHRGSIVADAPDEIVANTPVMEHRMLELADVATCRDEVVAGQDRTLEASMSRRARQDLAGKPGLVAHYCECKFAGTAAFMSKREMVTQWLSASAAFSDPFPHETRAKLDHVAENCAQRYGLAT